MFGHISQYDNLGKIGEGTYGVVMKSRHKGSGKLVAIKKFKEYEDEEEVRKTAMREVKVLQSIRHDNIICLLDVFHVRRRLYLVFEYVEGTVLQELERYPDGLGDMRTRQIMWQLVRAVEHLHRNQIVHRDIKPENMLLSSSGMLKLCDFGFARYLTGHSFDMSEYVATRWYRAPELLVGDKCYGQAVDIWAIGCMLVEMQTGQPLFPGADDTDQLWLILKSCTEEQLLTIRDSPILQYMKTPAPSERERLEDRLPMLAPEAIKFLAACLHPNPTDRKTAKELLQSPYLFGARSWFIKSFHPSEGKKQVRHAMSVERERGKPRQFRRCTESRNVLGSDALNISPFRGRPLQQMHDSPTAGQSPVFMDKFPLQNTPSPLSRLANGASDRSSSPMTPSSVPEASCHITYSKESKKGGSVINIAATSKPNLVSFERQDETMAEAACNSGAETSTSTVDVHRQDQESCEADSAGPRRSMRLQNNEQEHSSMAWQGADPRLSQQFASPDPRGTRQRGPSQSLANVGRQPLSQNQPARIPAQTSPVKGVAAWRVNGAAQAVGSMRPAESTVYGHGMAAPGSDQQQQGIPAYYGDNAHLIDNGSATSPKRWQPQALEEHSHPLSRQQFHRWASPSAADAENGGHAIFAGGNPPQYQSPLRAHAPVFVPSALQGRKADLH